MTIDEFKKNIAPYMKRGWVAMERDGTWEYSRKKPKIISGMGSCWDRGFRLDDWFNIEPVDNWKESLIEVGK